MAAKKKAMRPATSKKKTAPRKMPPRPAAASVTLESLSAQIAELAAAVHALRAVVTGRGGLALAPAPPSLADLDAIQGSRAIDYEAFERDLLATFAELDGLGRHGGLVPIPEIRIAFLDRGWTRDVFDERLLHAEREGVVELRAPEDAATLANPELAIADPERGRLQYVVAR